MVPHQSPKLIQNLAIFVFLLVLTDFTSGLTTIQTLTEIRELWSKTGTCADNEIKKWTASSPGSLVTAGYPGMTCATGYPLVGGYNVMGSAAINGYYQRTYTGLPSHNYIYYTMTIWALDTLDATDLFQLYFDGAVQNGLGWNFRDFYENLCGIGYNDLRNVRIFGRKAHSGSTLTFRLIDAANEYDIGESFGVREINFLFTNAATTDSLCTTSPVPLAIGSTCGGCPEGQYLSGGSCVACDPLCASCFGAGPANCYQCRVGASLIGNQCQACSAGCAICHDTTDTGCDACLTGYFLFNSVSCVYPCSSPLTQAVTANCVNTCSSPCASTSFVYWDGSCNTTCSAPLQQNTTVSYVKLCYYPCPDTSFLYWDGTCSTTCYEPLLQGTYLGKNFCYYTCADTQFLYWNGTCADYCLPPFTVSSSNGRQYCNNPCASSPSNYLYWNGSCISTCPSPLTSRLTDGNLYCDYGCEYNQFIYWDGSCNTTCPSPLSSRTEGTVRPRNYCDFTGATTSYLYWNGSYLSTCPSPFTSRVFRNRNFCDDYCPSTSWIYWNTSCLTSCDPPLLTRLEAGIQYCDFPCLGSQFYYWDTTCVSTCPAPLTQTVIGGTSPKYYCNYDCASTEFLYWNSSCLSTCDSPFTQTQIKTKNLCHFPCANTEYLHYDDSCQTNCQAPLIPRMQAGVSYCDYPCTSSEWIATWNNTCVSSCDSPFRTSTGPTIEQYCQLPCDDPLDFYYTKTGQCDSYCEAESRAKNDVYLECLPPQAAKPVQGLVELLLTATAGDGDPSLLSIHKLSQSVRYLNIETPTRLTRFTQNKAKGIVSWNLGIGMPSSLKEQITLKVLPAIYIARETPSSFLLNFWSDLVTLLLFIILACLFKVLEKTATVMSWNNLKRSFTILKNITLWNFCFVLIGYYAGDIFFYALLDIGSVKFDGTMATLSLFAAIIMLAVVVFFFVMNILVVRQFMKAQGTTENDNKVKTFHKNWQVAAVFYRGYKEQGWLQMIFYAVYVFRTILSPLITIICVHKPVVETTCQLIISVLILEYILIFKPLKSKVNNVQILCYEGAVLAINICALLLAVIDPDGTLRNSEIRTYLGDLIIIGNVFLNVTGIVFLIIKLVLEIKLIYLHRKAHSDSERLPWIRLVAIPLQQGAFGFEELIEPGSIESNSAKDETTLLDLRKGNAWRNAKANQIYPEPASSSLFKHEENALDLTNQSSLPLRPASSNLDVTPAESPEGGSPLISASKNRSLAKLRAMRKKPLDLQEEEEEKQEEKPPVNQEDNSPSRIRNSIRRLQRDQSAVTSASFGTTQVDVGRPPSENLQFRL